MVGYFAGPTSVLPVGRSDVIGKDCGTGHAQKQLTYLCKSLSILTGCPKETLRMILGCPVAKWVVSDACNALISCLVFTNLGMVSFIILICAYTFTFHQYIISIIQAPLVFINQFKPNLTILTNIIKNSDFCKFEKSPLSIVRLTPRNTALLSCVRCHGRTLS